MSTKTLRKRIALVAVSALGFGLVSAAPSIAAGSAVTSLVCPANATAGSDLTMTFAVSTTNYSAIALASGPVTNIPGEAAASKGDTLTSPNSMTAQGAATARSVTISGQNLIVPGTYVFDFSQQATSLASTDFTGKASCTVVVSSPASSSALYAKSKLSANSTSADPVIQVWRNTANTAGAIKLLVNSSPDADLVAGRVISAATGGGVYDVVDVSALGGGSTNSAATTFTFDSTSASNTGLITTAGTYSFTAFVDADGDGLVGASEPTAAVSFVIAGSAYAVSLSATKSVANDEDVVTFCATVTDSLGRAVATAPTLGEGTPATTVSTGQSLWDAGGVTGAINLGADSGTMTQVGTSNVYCATAVVESNDLLVDYYDQTITATISATVYGEATVRVINTDLTAIPNTVGAAVLAMTAADGIGSVSTTTGLRQILYTTGGANIGSSTTPIDVDKSVVTQNYKLQLATTEAGEYVKIVTAPLVGTSTTIIANSTQYKQVTADGSVIFSVTATAPTSGKGYSVTVSGTSNPASAYVAFRTVTPQIAVSPSANVKAIFGASTKFTATLSDQFGRALAAKTLVYTVGGGRNATTTGTLTTATDGSASYTLVDAAGAADAVNLTDTLNLTYNYVDALGAAATATGSGSVTYSATGVVVGSITLTPAATTDVTISQTSGLGTTTYVAHTAQVYLSTGLPAGAGVLVTCTGGADDKFYLGVSTAVTNAAGTATCNVFRTKTGNTAIKASAGGVSSPTATSILFKNDAGAIATDGSGTIGTNDARNVTVSSASTVAGSVATVTATVTDRWGNPVEGILVTWSYLGVGRPVTGADLTVGTDSNGKAQIQMTAVDSETGTSTVTATISTTTNQTLDTDGYVSPSGSNTTAVAGVTAGNYVANGTVTFTKNTATSTADALLALATALGTREQAAAAVDAAAEATDAANAATDAANAAAEAADAATAAAQDAADAVAALSTQVSEMVASLKKQIVSLTNLVIKIQKKVKA